jgi:tripartite-type tricarboxylate transporter receptor subunit TctC
MICIHLWQRSCVRQIFMVHALCWLAAWAGSLHAQTQAFPSKPIQVVVPVATGGGTDLLARTLGQKVGESLGQPMVIENRLGAGGNIGAEIVAHAKPDGYTLLVTPGTIATNVAVYRKLPYDLLKDFQVVTLVGQTGVVLVVHPSMKAQTFPEFVAWAKTHPGELSYGSAGLGSPQQLHTEFFNQLLGIKTTHIPYKGQSQAMQDLVGGQLNYMFSPLQNALPYIQQGRIRPLVVASAKRYDSLPQVPAIGEFGHKGVELSNWFAVFAPAGTPAPVIRKLNEAFVKVGRSADMREKLNTLGFVPFFTSPEEGTDFMRSELTRWARVAAYAGIQAE